MQNRWIKRISIIVAVGIVMLCGVSVLLARKPAATETIVLLKRTTSWNDIPYAAYPQGQCAEAGAIAAMVAAGARRIAAVLVLAAGPPLCPPCGGCRQRLAEFAGPDVPVHLCDLAGERLTISLGELLPLAFTAANFRRP